ncbi:hypothetical protein [Sphingobium sp. ZW T5_29]|uniref:hypothetical protein n=1 Tax=Sphingobium sp. ZW T5_29 TaxID=3378077 RepID=UPI00385396B5
MECGVLIGAVLAVLMVSATEDGREAVSAMPGYSALVASLTGAVADDRSKPWDRCSQLMTIGVEPKDFSKRARKRIDFASELLPCEPYKRTAPDFG